MEPLVYWDTVLDILFKISATILNVIVIFVVNSENIKKFLANTFKKLWKKS